MVITEPQSAIKNWLTSRINYVPTPNMVCLGQYSKKDNALVAVVGYDGWSEAAVEMHVAGIGRRWMTKEFLYKCFYYPFVIGKVNVVLGRVSSDNEAAVQLDTKLGFKEMCRIPNAWDGGHDLIVFAMQKHECRWLNMGHKQKEAA